MSREYEYTHRVYCKEFDSPCNSITPTALPIIK